MGAIAWGREGADRTESNNYPHERENENEKEKETKNAVQKPLTLCGEEKRRQCRRCVKNRCERHVLLKAFVFAAGLPFGSNRLRVSVSTTHTVAVCFNALIVSVRKYSSVLLYFIAMSRTEETKG